MDKRLQQFLDAENISQAQLAETLGVARAGISHILSGRNKPGFDFLEAMATRFPQISMDWLLTGKGRPHPQSKAVCCPTVSATRCGIKNSVWERSRTSATAVVIMR